MDDAPNDRDVEQGEVDGPLECSLTLGKVRNAAVRLEVKLRNGMGGCHGRLVMMPTYRWRLLILTSVAYDTQDGQL